MFIVSLDIDDDNTNKDWIDYRMTDIVMVRSNSIVRHPRIWNCYFIEEEI